MIPLTNPDSMRKRQFRHGTWNRRFADTLVLEQDSIHEAILQEFHYMSEENATIELPDWVSEHLELYAQDPQQGHDWDSTVVGGPGVLPVLLLTTKGRKSGAMRTLPLIYGTANGGFVIIASKGGAPSHPAWFLNLVETPECEIQVAHDYFRVRARTAEGAERETLWEQLAAIYPPYDDYQAATTRKIPVVVLNPVG